MADLKGTKIHQNLKDAFASESQANRRYLYFAKQADAADDSDCEIDEAEVVYWGRCPECLAAAPVSAGD